VESSRVGPYLVIGPLGAGGMGEVYEAWDERLERSVAIKRVTPDPTGAAPDPRRRERLRREARAAGRLSHPAIVQIYDVVETDEADWIGVFPFKAATPVETLHRVCTYQPPPAAELNPAVPLLLSELIAELLEKDRERRPADAHQVAARLAALPESRSGSGGRLSSGSLALEPTVTEVPVASPRRRARLRWAAGGLALLLLAAAGLLAWALRRREPLEPLYVAVAEPQVQTHTAQTDSGDPETSLAAAGLRAALLRDLAGFDRIAVLTPEPGGATAPRALARQLAADEVLVPRLDCAGRTCRISLSRLQAADGRLLWSESFDVPADDVSLIAAAVGPVLRRGYDGFSRRPGAAGPEIGREEWERYVRLDQDFWEHRGDSPSRRLLEEVEALRRQAPRFVEVLLLEADLYSLRFFDSRDPADAERARGLLAEARRLAPGDPRPLWFLANVDLTAEQLRDAEAAVAELAEQVPGDNRVQMLRARLAEHRGWTDEALERMRAAARRRPGQYNLLGLANLESRLGRMDEARRTLATLLARFPNDRNARSFLAQLELSSGSAETAARLYAELVRAEPTFTELTNLGVAQLLLGRYDPAAASFRQALGLLPQSPAAVLNLADAEWLRGRKAEAAALYGKVIDLAARDPAPTFWQTQSIRGAISPDQPAVVTVYQSAGRGPECTITLSGDKETAAVLVQQNYCGLAAGEVTAKVVSGNARHVRTVNGAYRNTPGMVFFALGF
jgi:tetratricopeptide (TPR) repeat protein/TolB-like protein